MHSGMLPPAGVAEALEFINGSPWAKVKVVEPNAVKLVDAKAYKAFSIGIADYDLVRDPAAPNGRIICKLVNEISLVDYPANPRCKFSLAKRAASGAIEEVDELEMDEGARKYYEEVLAQVEEKVDTIPISKALEDELAKAAATPSAWYQDEITKRNVSQAERDSMDDADFAGKDDSFPIHKPADVAAAASSIGRAGSDNYDTDTLKRNIIRIARRKGPDYVAQLPEAWKDGGKMVPDPDLPPTINKAVPQGSKECAKCKGLGVNGKGNKCGKCKGMGFVSAGGGEPSGDKPAEKAADGASCPTCDGKGTIMEGNRKCPDCNGTGKKAVKASASDEKVDEEISQAEAAIEDVKEAQEEDEDDDDDDKAFTGNTKPSDDPSGGEVPPAPSRPKEKGKERKFERRMKRSAPYAVQRLHDVLCPLYEGRLIKSLYNLSKETPVTDLLDLTFFADRKKVAAAATGLKELSYPDLARRQEAAHKAVSDAYPDVRVTPAMIQASDFTRPFLPGATSEQASTSDHPFPAPNPLRPEDFTRGPLSDNQTRQSLVGGTAATTTAGISKGNRWYYRTADRDEKMEQMQQVHDSIANNFPSICGMTGPDATYNEKDQHMGAPEQDYSPPPDEIGITNHDDETLRSISEPALAGATKGLSPEVIDSLRAMTNESISTGVTKALKPVLKRLRKAERTARRAAARPDPLTAPIRASSPLNFAAPKADKPDEAAKKTLERIKVLKMHIRSGVPTLADPATEELRQLVTPKKFAQIVTEDDDED